LVIDLPAFGFTDAAFNNLQKLAAGKAALIRMALGKNLAGGAEALPILRGEEKVCFPWFRSDMEPGEIAAWLRFVSSLCIAAKKQKRVILKEKEPGEGASERFAMRCFLLKLGFIGDETKEARRIILARLPGNGSHKTGDGKKVQPDPEIACAPRDTAADGLLEEASA
jgi:hypothetical protein